MKGIIGVLIVVIAVTILAFASGLVFILDERKQVIITQFGQPLGEPIAEAGLYFKIPFIQQANYFEKRILQWDGDPNQIPTEDKKYIWVDTFARWQIDDVLLYLQSVGNEVNAHTKLDNIINSATRNVIAGHQLIEAIRDSDRILEATEIEADMSLAEEALEPIKLGRRSLEKLILEKAGRLAPQYGIKLVDVRIKRINYVENVRNKVYDRMIAERKRAAAEYRSEGQGKSAEIEGQLVKELKLITSEAYRKAEGIKGKADAEAINIYAQAYQKDPNFYSFVKTMQTYRDTIDEYSTVILSTDSEYYKYLKQLQ